MCNAAFSAIWRNSKHTREENVDRRLSSIVWSIYQSIYLSIYLSNLYYISLYIILSNEVWSIIGLFCSTAALGLAAAAEWKTGYPEEGGYILLIYHPDIGFCAQLEVSINFGYYLDIYIFIKVYFNIPTHLNIFYIL